MENQGGGSRLKIVRDFFDEVLTEMRKTSWPERSELVESTLVVIISLVLLGVIVGVYDKILVELLKVILPSG
jgi:preprotein translocase subunit SecE